MWNCGECGCKNIAASLDVCPMCFKEAPMPKITSAGPSNRWEEPELRETPEASQEPVDEVSEAMPSQEPEQTTEAPETGSEGAPEQEQPQQPTVEELQAQIAQIQSQNQAS